MFRVVVEAPATRDIANAYNFLKDSNAGSDYPEEWFDDIERAIASLCDFPFAHPKTPAGADFIEDARNMIHGSYRIVYVVVGEWVRVVRVLHTSQNIFRMAQG